MKTAKNIKSAARKAFGLMLLVLLVSCGSTYNVKTADIENDLLTGNFDMALVHLDQNKFLQKDRNRLLYLLEKGKLEHLKGNYQASNAIFEEAYILIDDRIRTNVGQAVAAKFTNAMAEPYKGEDFEKVTIHYYKALNYFHMGMPNEALVEAKRINIKLDELNQKYNENKNKYSEDAFSLILTGILYECTGDINGAFIAYRNAYEIYERNGGTYYGVAIPEQLKQDLLRTTKQLGFTQEHNDYRAKFNIPANPAPAPPTANNKNGKGKAEPVAQQPKPEPKWPTGEAIIFWENGLGPVKDQIVITASGGSGVFFGTWQDGDVMEEILIPIPVGTDVGSINAIAIPKYRKRDNYYTGAALEYANTDHRFELAEDFYPIAKQCLKDRMLRETIDLVLRFATKKAGSSIFGEIVGQVAGDTAGDIAKLAGDAAGAATEQADTRNWQSLPQTISYLRVPLSETGNNKFILKKYGAYGMDTDTINIAYKKGLQIVNYFDLSRNQIITPAGTTTAGTTALLAGLTNSGAASLELAQATAVTTAPVTGSIEDKYNRWCEASNGISYMVTYELQNVQGQNFYVKKVSLKSSNPGKVNVKFALTDEPLDNRYAEVSAGEFYRSQSQGTGAKEYFSISEKVKPGKEVQSSGVYHLSPDFYVTILSVE
jgi:uncharacterized protein